MKMKWMLMTVVGLFLFALAAPSAYAKVGHPNRPPPPPPWYNPPESSKSK
jgi:hypothetical protein